jgi:hypothetical protein
MSIWGITVVIAVVIALFSILALLWLHRRRKEPYSHCFWKGFLAAFLGVTIIFATLRLTGVIHLAMLSGLPFAFGIGSLTGLITEIIRNKMTNKDFWKNC